MTNKLDPNIYITPIDKSLMKRINQTPMDRLNNAITNGFSTREKKLYQDYMTVRLKLSNLEDDVLGMYSPDWFRCESCATVTHGDHKSAHYADSDHQICAMCAPELED
jgi:hypothetical protein